MVKLTEAANEIRAIHRLLAYAESGAADILQLHFLYWHLRALYK